MSLDTAGTSAAPRRASECEKYGLIRTAHPYPRGLDAVGTLEAVVVVGVRLRTRTLRPSHRLSADGLLDPSDLFLNFPCHVLIPTFGLQVRIPGGVSNLLFDCAFTSCAVPLITSFVLSFMVVPLPKPASISMAKRPGGLARGSSISARFSIQTQTLFQSVRLIWAEGLVAFEFFAP